MKKIFPALVVVVLSVSDWSHAGAPPPEAFDQPGAFCESTIRHGMSERLFNMSESELQSRLDRGEMPPLGPTSPWIGLQYPDIRVRRAFFESITGDGIRLSMAEIRKRVFEANPQNITSLFASVASCGSTECTEDYFREYQRRGSSMTLSPNKSFFPAIAACTGVISENFFQCVRSLQYQVRLSQGWLDMVLLKTAREWMTVDLEKYPQALPLAMMKLAQITFNRIDHQQAQGSLFTDIRLALQDAGIPSSEIDNLAWKTIAVAAISGANTAHFLIKLATPTSAAMVLGLHVATKGLEVLNSISIPKLGRIYSMPETVHGACNNAKFYHFWMAAFLARASAQKGISPQIAAKTAYLLHVGYQFNAPYGSGRDLAQSFFTGTFGNANLRSRIDFSVASTGAKFGAYSLEPTGSVLVPPLSIDATLAHLLRSATDLPTLTESQARELYSKKKLHAFKRWNKIVTPMAAFTVPNASSL